MMSLSPLLHFPVGTRVVLTGLQKAPTYNGRTGIVEGEKATTGHDGGRGAERLAVRLDPVVTNTQIDRVMALRPDNLSLEPRPASSLSVAELKIILMNHHLSVQKDTRGMEKSDLQTAVPECINDPKTIAEFLHAYNQQKRKQQPQILHQKKSQSGSKNNDCIAPASATAALAQLGTAEPAKIQQVFQMMQAMPPEQLQAQFPSLGSSDNQFQQKQLKDTLSFFANNPNFLKTVASEHTSAEAASKAVFNKIYGEPAKNGISSIAEGHTGNTAESSHDEIVDSGRSLLEEKEGKQYAWKVFLYAVENWTVLDVEELLLEDPSLVYAQEINGKRMTGLHLAASTDRAIILKALLRYGAPVEARDRDDDTALHLAAQFGCVNALRVLLQAGANPNVENRKYKNMPTPLEGAISSGHINAAKILLEERYGCKNRMNQKEMNRALFQSTIHWDVPCAKLLLEHGADVNSTLPGKEMTIFQLACGEGEIGFVKLFIEHNVNIMFKVGRLTAMHIAITNERDEVVELLKNSGQMKESDEIMEIEKMKHRAQLFASTNVTCNGCHQRDKLKCEYYECLSCTKQNIVRHFCPSCVLNSRQLANKYCPNHVLVRRGQLPLPNGKKLRGTVERRTAEGVGNERNRLWLEAETKPLNCFGLYNIVKQLSLSYFLATESHDTGPLLSILVFHIPILEKIYSRLKPLSERHLIGQITNEMAKLLPGQAMYINDLTRWIKSRAMRPRNGQPAWVALVGSSSLIPHAVCEMIGWVAYTKLQEGFHLFPSLHNRKTRLCRKSDDFEQPVLTGTFVGDLPVALISSIDLFRRDRMPEHCQCLWDQNDSSHILPSGPTLKLFVSHAWRSPEHPDKDGVDWLALREFLYESVMRCIVLYINLSAMGFDLSSIAEDAFLDPALEREGLEFARLYGNADMGDVNVQQPDGPSSGAVTRAVSYDPLMSQLLQILCFCRGSEAGFPVDEDIPSLFQAVTDRIFLWIDFVSLPQNVSRERTSYEEQWFRESLAQMGNIQRTMLSVLVDPGKAYYSRAWCAAEYINTNQEYSIARPVGEGDATLPPNRPDMEAWLRSMVTTEVASAEHVIRRLELGITNNADADSVCAVVWSRVADYLQQTATTGRTGSSDMMVDYLGMGKKSMPPWVVARGRASYIVEYLNALQTDEFQEYHNGWLKWRKKLHLAKENPNSTPGGVEGGVGDLVCRFHEMLFPDSSETTNEDDIGEQNILFLVDSCVASRPHRLLPSLQSLAVFIATKIVGNATVKVSFLSDYTEASLNALKHTDESNDDRTLIVALPTSIFADQADYVILHPSFMPFQEKLPRSLQNGTTCVVS